MKSRGPSKSKKLIELCNRMTFKSINYNFGTRGLISFNSKGLLKKPPRIIMRRLKQRARGIVKRLVKVERVYMIILQRKRRATSGLKLKMNSAKD